MLLESERIELVQYCRRFISDGLLIGTSGNLSVRQGDLIALTPRRKSYADVTPDAMCVLDIDGRIIERGGGPSSETPMHLAIYRRSSAAGIVHTHSKYATVLSTVVEELPAVHYIIAGLGGAVRVAPYATYGTQKLADNVVNTLGESHAVLLRNHGAITVGESLKHAYDRSITLEWLCEIYYHARLLGQPAILPDEEIERVRERMRSTAYDPSVQDQREGRR